MVLKVLYVYVLVGTGIRGILPRVGFPPPPSFLPPPFSGAQQCSPFSTLLLSVRECLPSAHRPPPTPLRHVAHSA